MQNRRTGGVSSVQGNRNTDFPANATTKEGCHHFSKLTNQCVYFGFLRRLETLEGKFPSFLLALPALTRQSEGIIYRNTIYRDIDESGEMQPQAMEMREVRLIQPWLVNNQAGLAFHPFG